MGKILIDVDIFQLQEYKNNDGLDSLLEHPAVKRVTPQRMVVRHLHFVDDDDGDANEFNKSSNYTQNHEQHSSSEQEPEPQHQCKDGKCDETKSQNEDDLEWNTTPTPFRRSSLTLVSI